MDKDTLITALNTAHDTHLLAVDNREDDIARRAGKDLAAILEEIQKNELARNRKKVSEIDYYIDLQRQECSGTTASGASSTYR